MSDNNPALRPNMTVVNLPPKPRPPMRGRRALREVAEKARIAEAQMYVLGVLQDSAIRNAARGEEMALSEALSPIGMQAMVSIIQATATTSCRIIAATDSKELR